MPQVNPEILTWARQTAGLTREEAARKLGFKDAQKWTAVERLNAYESGQDDPSRSVLAKMSKQYHRPPLTFYLSTPPRKGDRGTDFRTLSADRSPEDDAILDALIRDVQARQSTVRAVMEDQDDVEPLSFIASHEMSDGWQAIISSLRSLLEVRRAEYRVQPDAAASFALLRTAAEKAGVFVLLKGNLGTHHTEIGTEVFRGFSIADGIAPFVVINEYDARTAWSFTLLHELVHLLLGQTGIGNARANNDTEQFCDDIAGKFLLKDSEIWELGIGRGSDIYDCSERIGEFASKWNLSRAMIAYRACRIGAISQPTYESLSRYFRGQWLTNRDNRRDRQRQSGGGGDFYLTRRHRIGNRLITLVRRMMDTDELSTSKAATVLGVKPQQVQSLFD